MPDAPAGLRVLAPNNITRNTHMQLLFGAIRDRGVAVDEVSSRRLASGRYDVWHTHWPELLLNASNPVRAMLNLARFFAMIELARARGVRIVWTVHNLQSHEQARPTLERWFWRRFLRRIHGFISLSRTAHELTLERYPRLASLRSWVIPRGHYRGAYADQVSRAEARARLGYTDEHEVFAFVGLIREYKNLPRLISAFRGLPGPHRRLLIAGRARPELGAEISALCEGDSRIQLHQRFIADDELQYYLRSADVVTLPYTEILNSGAALLALSFDRPVLAPHRGMLVDLQAAVGSAWVFTYENELTTEVLERAMRWARSPGRQSRAPLDQLDWSGVAEKTIVAYREVCGLVLTGAG